MQSTANRRNVVAILAMFSVLISCNTSLSLDNEQVAETSAERDARMQWWREARFGMFIHWGFYAVPAGVHNGQIVDASHGSEWIQCDALLSREQYEPYAAQFNPVDFDAEAWVRLAREAGMKYLVITSKHHDGFSMYDSAVSDYNIVKSTPFDRDPLKKLSEACQKQGVHFGVYYSQLDWHHPAQENDPQREERNAYRFNRIRPGMKDAYIADMKAQLKELIQDYHVEVLFFDGEWVPWWTQQDGRDLMQYVRSLNPAIIVNNRIGKRKKEDGDYGTPEQKIPAAGLDYDWETCMTLNGTWGYKSYDHKWKTTEDLIHKLVDIASKGGNFLLNVGPDAKGIIPGPSAERLREIGQWLAMNGEAVYATRLWNPTAQFDPDAGADAFGPGPEEVADALPTADDSRKGDTVRFTRKDDVLYAVLLEWPADGKVVLKQLARGRTASPIAAVDLLGSTTALTWNCDREGLHVELPKQKPCQHAWVLKVVGEAARLHE
ncbi:alpha-L-fucosidase [Novipirellula artificiosorum]|uniref:alpha-L-fucosidase n=1 Tax=Novipirellula artificiosorum TaxID=2528016 RepID=A0A5C6D4V5_9BACT|nr:alpha-L-fucosidase [Novipirellula artificiosorum]TWU31962.1 Alpha-L-fucosidase [Novipirellula artificiosorum]